jgi:uncharacterized membrane protein
MKDAMKRILKILRTTLVGGLLFLVPVVALVVVLGKALALAHKLVAPLAEHLPVHSVIGLRTPVFLAIAIIVLFCFLAGVLARTALARKLVRSLESAVLADVPGYELLKGMGESMLGVEKQTGHQVVLARIEDAWQIAFLVERLDGGHVAVFVPGAPNPLSGSVYFMTQDRIKAIDIPAAGAMKCLRRVGAGSNALLRGLLTLSLTLWAALTVPAGFAQPADEEKPKAANVALDLHNPVATLTSIHLEQDWDFGYGNAKATAYTASLIPVVPFSLSPDWNLITRTVVPAIYAESPFSGGSRGGLGDIVATIYLSPDQPMHGWYWGAGPGLILPSATDPLLGAGKWSAGPTVAVLRQDGPWTAGALTGHAWSFASSRIGPAVSTTYLQPFLSYTTGKDTTFGVDSPSEYDWKGRQWTVPLEATIGQVLTIARQQLELDLAGRWYAERAPGGPHWGLSLTLTFLFPK